MRIGGTFANALSGIASAFQRVNAASHNVANLQTEDFKPLRVDQSEREGGGSIAVTRQVAEPQSVDLAREFVESDLAKVQAQASMNVIKTESEILGSLINTKA